jgi:hypothetical protein
VHVLGKSFIFRVQSLLNFYFENLQGLEQEQEKHGAVALDC